MNYVVGFEYTFESLHRDEPVRLDAFTGPDASQRDRSATGGIHAGHTDGPEQPAIGAAGRRLRFYSAAILGSIAAVHHYRGAAEFDGLG